MSEGNIQYGSTVKRNVSDVNPQVNPQPTQQTQHNNNPVDQGELTWDPVTGGEMFVAGSVVTIGGIFPAFLEHGPEWALIFAGLVMMGTGYYCHYYLPKIK